MRTTLPGLSLPTSTLFFRSASATSSEYVSSTPSTKTGRAATLAAMSVPLGSNTDAIDVESGAPSTSRSAANRGAPP